MIDVNFYMKAFELKKKLMAGNAEGLSKETVRNQMEEFRDRTPVIYDIETTNACNMECIMCPRTTRMTRKIETMSMELFKKIADQISPFSEDLLGRWENFVLSHYGVGPGEMNENHFFLYIIPRVLVLHGYGEPTLDAHMARRIKLLTERQIPSYFSCTPANIILEKMEEIFENGLDYIKFSIESTDDATQKKIRGKASDFTKGYEKMLGLFDLKKRNGYKTTIIITMVDLNQPWQEDEFPKLVAAFKGKDAYIYFKSQNQKWYQKKNQPTKSIHWTEFCQFPWSSMTIRSNGEAVGCIGDYNNEILVGDTTKESLCDIWNGGRYRRLRENHFNATSGLKCTKECDMALVGHLI